MVYFTRISLLGGPLASKGVRDLKRFYLDLRWWNSSSRVPFWPAVQRSTKLQSTADECSQPKTELARGPAPVSLLTTDIPSLRIYPRLPSSLSHNIAVLVMNGHILLAIKSPSMQECAGNCTSASWSGYICVQTTCRYSTIMLGLSKDGSTQVGCARKTKYQ